LNAVLDEFYARPGATLNTTLNLTFIPNQDDFRSSINLRLSANDAIDGVFDAQWATMLDYIARDIYLPLDEYFNNPDYPGLFASFQGAYYQNNKFAGSDGERRTYGIPFAQTHADLNNFLIIRQDWREEAGMQPLRNMDDFEAYADWILANKPGVFPLGRNGDIPNWLWEQPGISGRNVRWGETLGFQELIDVPAVGVGIGMGIIPRVIFNTELTRAIGVMWPVMTTADVTAQGVPANVANRLVRNPESPTLSAIYRERGYIEPDIALQNATRDLFWAGMFGAVFGGWGNVDTDTARITAVNPDARLEVFMFSEDRRNMRPGTFSTDFMAFNFMCIPVTSRNVERTMRLFCWIMESQENNDLMTYGIEGVHWEPAGDGFFSWPSYVDRANNFSAIGGGYQFTWNPNFVRYNIETPPDRMEYFVYMTRDDTYIGRPTAGFSFNSDPVRAELAAAGQIFNDNQQNNAIAGTTPAQVRDNNAQALARMRAVGLDAINTELLRQVNAFLEAKR
jgi:putative aldouronate transport system substrate-binding protein